MFYISVKVQMFSKICLQDWH